MHTQKQMNSTLPAPIPGRALSVIQNTNMTLILAPPTSPGITAGEAANLCAELGTHLQTIFSPPNDAWRLALRWIKMYGLEAAWIGGYNVSLNSSQCAAFYHPAHGRDEGGLIAPVCSSVLKGAICAAAGSPYAVRTDVPTASEFGSPFAPQETFNFNGTGMVVLANSTQGMLLSEARQACSHLNRALYALDDRDTTSWPSALQAVTLANLTSVWIESFNGGASPCLALHRSECNSHPASIAMPFADCPSGRLPGVLCGSILAHPSATERFWIPTATPQKADQVIHVNGTTVNLIVPPNGLLFTWRQAKLACALQGKSLMMVMASPSISWTRAISVLNTHEIKSAWIGGWNTVPVLCLGFYSNATGEGAIATSGCDSGKPAVLCDVPSLPTTTEDEIWSSRTSYLESSTRMVTSSITSTFVPFMDLLDGITFEEAAEQCHLGNRTLLMLWDHSGEVWDEIMALTNVQIPSGESVWIGGYGGVVSSCFAISRPPHGPGIISQVTPCTSKLFGAFCGAPSMNSSHITPFIVTRSGVSTATEEPTVLSSNVAEITEFPLIPTQIPNPAIATSSLHVPTSTEDMLLSEAISSCAALNSTLYNIDDQPRDSWNAALTELSNANLTAAWIGFYNGVAAPCLAFYRSNSGAIAVPFRDCSTGRLPGVLCGSSLSDPSSTISVATTHSQLIPSILPRDGFNVIYSNASALILVMPFNGTSLTFVEAQMACASEGKSLLMAMAYPNRKWNQAMTLLLSNQVDLAWIGGWNGISYECMVLYKTMEGSGSISLPGCAENSIPAVLCEEFSDASPKSTSAASIIPTESVATGDQYAIGHSIVVRGQHGPITRAEAVSLCASLNRPLHMVWNQPRSAWLEASSLTITNVPVGGSVWVGGCDGVVSHCLALYRPAADIGALSQPEQCNSKLEGAICGPGYNDTETVSAGNPTFSESGPLMTPLAMLGYSMVDSPMNITLVVSTSGGMTAFEAASACRSLGKSLQVVYGQASITWMQTTDWVTRKGLVAVWIGGYETQLTLSSCLAFYRPATAEGKGAIAAPLCSTRFPGAICGDYVPESLSSLGRTEQGSVTQLPSPSPVPSPEPINIPLNGTSLAILTMHDGFLLEEAMAACKALNRSLYNIDDQPRESWNAAVTIANQAAISAFWIGGYNEAASPCLAFYRYGAIAMPFTDCSVGRLPGVMCGPNVIPATSTTSTMDLHTSVPHVIPGQEYQVIASNTTELSLIISVPPSLFTCRQARTACETIAKQLINFNGTMGAMESEHAQIKSWSAMYGISSSWIHGYNSVEYSCMAFYACHSGSGYVVLPGCDAKLNSVLCA
jgi:hypothetical protein